MDYSVGFGVPIILLSGGAVIWSAVDLIRKKKNYFRYTLISTAGLFNTLGPLIRIISPDVHHPTAKYTADHVYSDAGSLFFHIMFVPLLYCIAFEICRTEVAPKLQSSMDMLVDSHIVQRYHISKLFPVYIAYMWTILTLLASIAYCALYNSKYQLYDHTQTILRGLAAATTHGVWVYVILAVLQVSFVYRHVRPFGKSLGLYFGFAITSSAGVSATSEIFRRSSANFTGTVVSFVFVELVGSLDLLWALWCSQRYWTQSLLEIQQQYYNYVSTSSMSVPQQDLVAQPPERCANRLLYRRSPQGYGYTSSTITTPTTRSTFDRTSFY